ncbi:putative Wgr [Gammaproteobacteria bacterium]
MPNIYEWLNQEKLRYYKIAVTEEGTNGIVLAHDWGSCISNRGGKKNLLVQTQEEAQKFIAKMMKRRKSRGYELVAPYG